MHEYTYAHFYFLSSHFRALSKGLVYCVGIKSESNNECISSKCVRI